MWIRSTLQAQCMVRSKLQDFWESIHSCCLATFQNTPRLSSARLGIFGSRKKLWQMATWHKNLECIYFIDMQICHGNQLWMKLWLWWLLYIICFFIIHHVAPSRTFKKCFQPLEHFATDCHASGNGSSPKSSSSSSRSARSAHVPPKELEVGRLATESGPFDSDCIERLGLAYFNQTSFLPASVHSRTQGLFEGNKSTLNCMLLKFLHKYPLKLHEAPWSSPRNTCQCHLSGSGVPVDGVKLRRRRGRRPRGRWGAAAQAWKENCRHGILIWFVQTGCKQT